VKRNGAHYANFINDMSIEKPLAVHYLPKAIFNLFGGSGTKLQINLK
jgi:hypothetical protein